MSSSNTLLQGKKVVIVGGSSGIGKAVAAAALANGATVVISSSSQARVDAALATLKESGSSVSGVAVDVKNAESFKAFLSGLGNFDHLVYTAAEALAGGFPGADITEKTREQFESRYWAPMIAAQHIYRNKLINPGGSITMTIGTVFNRPIPGWGLVSGVAGATESATRGLAVDLKPIRVNTISPGIVDTEYWNGLASDDKNNIFEWTEKNVLVGHVGKPQEIAEAYIFAMKCSYLTGQIITVDGGGTLV